MKTPHIAFDPGKGIVYDFIAVIVNALKFSDMSSMYAEFDYKPDEIVSASYKRLQSVVKKRESSMFKLLFSVGENDMSLFSSFSEFLVKSESIDELIDRLVNYDPELYYARIMSYFDIDHKFSLNFYTKIIKDKELLMEFLSGLKMTPVSRLAFINFIEFYSLMLSELKKDLLIIKKELEIEYEILQQYREEFYSKLENKLNLNNPDVFYERYCSYRETLSDTVFDEVRVSALVYVPLSIQFIGDVRKLYIYFGADHDKDLNTRKNTISDISFIFKAFTDITRIKVLHLIKEKGSVNYTQLSKELDVPLSSMSHHIDILAEAGIIERRNEGKRSFFSLNKTGFQNAVDILNGFI